MKTHALLLLLVGLGSLAIAGQLRADSDTPKVRRVHLQATSGPPLALIVAAEATEGEGGVGTDLSTAAEGDFCTQRYDEVRINESGDTVVLIGRNMQAADPFDYGAYVKITAHTDGRVNFVLQAINPNGHHTGAAGVDLTGTVKIEQLLP
jgi:hypothetical protein